ncbi:MAG: 23S rRNA (adenine(2503)-C(2))-methyltransferase RlmN [Bacteriovorax sp.]
MNSDLKPSIFSLCQKELKQFLQENSHSPHLSTSIYEVLYKKNISQNISVKTWKILQDAFSFDLPKIVNSLSADDGTIKFLMEMNDGQRVETVLIPFHKRYTVCLSSQVGCAMKCSFCFTGTQGLSRNLKSSEIIGQYIVAKKYLEKEIDQNAIAPNIVFMGQGEPLHNFDEVKLALNIMLDPEGLGLGPRQITLSTAGYLPGLKKFNQLPKINLALSLHSPFNETRKSLIPITGQYPIENIFEALDEVKLMKRQFITYEYILIDEVNDRLEDAIALKELLLNRKAIINIIPFNPFPGGSFKRPSNEKIEHFKEMLVERKLRTLVRTTKGSDILAACGQLTS